MTTYDDLVPQPVSPSSNVPIPDPTLLTTEALMREIAALKHQLDARIDAVQALITGRIDAIDEATRLRLEAIAGVPHQINERVKYLQDLTDEKFASVFRMFEERDVRTAQASTASDQALQAALQAAKELVTAQGEASAQAAAKVETSFTKQIDQIMTLIQTLEKAIDARLVEVKERIDRGEGQGQGRQEHHVEKRADSALNLQGLAVIIALIGLAVVVIVAFVK